MIVQQDVPKTITLGVAAVLGVLFVLMCIWYVLTDVFEIIRF